MSSISKASETPQPLVDDVLCCLRVRDVEDYTEQASLLLKGFLQDRQINARTGNLALYLNANRLDAIKDSLFGLQVTARPTVGFVHYCAAELRSNGTPIHDVLVAKQTTYVDVTLRRRVDKNTFRFDSASEAPHSFKKLKPGGDLC